MSNVKHSLAALKHLFNPASGKGKKAKTMDSKKDVKTDALEEISKLTQYFQNIELMHNETARI